MRKRKLGIMIQPSPSTEALLPAVCGRECVHVRKGEHHRGEAAHRENVLTLINSVISLNCESNA